LGKIKKLKERQMKVEIDVEQFAKDIKAGKSISGKDGILSSLIKQLTEAALEAEIDSHLAQDVEKNRRNGYTLKTMKSEFGNFELDTPRDRNGSFEPQVVKKHQTTMTDEKEKFEFITKNNNWDKFRETLLFLIKSKINFEVRTTVHTDLLNEKDINEIIDILVSMQYRGKYYLQNFFESDKKTLGNIGKQTKKLDITKLSTKIPIEFRNF
jgi:hypothetical protein